MREKLLQRAVDGSHHSLHHSITGGSGDMPPKVGCCFMTKSWSKKGSPTLFPVPDTVFLNWQLIEEIKKVIFCWISSFYGLQCSCMNFGTAWAKGSGCVAGRRRTAWQVWPLGISPDLDGHVHPSPETSVLGAHVWRCGHDFSLHLRIT